MTSITSDSDDDDDMVGALIYKSSITAKVRALAAADAEENRRTSMDKRENMGEDQRGDSSAPERRISFPFKLYAMLEYAADSLYSSAVSWNPDGRSFVVVPGHFKLHFRSLKHQLDLWGFKSLNQDGWFHKYFVRGNMHGLQRMKRTEIEGPSKSEQMMPQRKVHEALEEIDRRLKRGGEGPLSDRGGDGPSMDGREISSPESTKSDDVEQQLVVEEEAGAGAIIRGSKSSWNTYKKICSHEGCVDYSLKEGVCIRHHSCSKSTCDCFTWIGATRTKRICNHEGCTKFSQQGGVCCEHGAKADRVCNYPGCKNIPYARGKCRKHDMGKGHKLPKYSPVEGSDFPNPNLGPIECSESKKWPSNNKEEETTPKKREDQPPTTETSPAPQRKVVERECGQMQQRVRQQAQQHHGDLGAMPGSKISSQKTSDAGAFISKNAQATWAGEEAAGDASRVSTSPVVHNIEAPMGHANDRKGTGDASCAISDAASNEEDDEPWYFQHLYNKLAICSHATCTRTVVGVGGLCQTHTPKLHMPRIEKSLAEKLPARDTYPVSHPRFSP